MKHDIESLKRAYDLPRADSSFSFCCSDKRTQSVSKTISNLEEPSLARNISQSMSFKAKSNTESGNKSPAVDSSTIRYKSTLSMNSLRLCWSHLLRTLTIRSGSGCRPNSFMHSKTFFNEIYAISSDRRAIVTTQMHARA